MKKIFKRIVIAIVILVIGIVIGRHNTHEENIKYYGDVKIYADLLDNEIDHITVTHNKKDNFFVVMVTDKNLDAYFFEVTDENKIKFKTVE